MNDSEMAEHGQKSEILNERDSRFREFAKWLAWVVGSGVSVFVALEVADNFFLQNGTSPEQFALIAAISGILYGTFIGYPETSGR